MFTRVSSYLTWIEDHIGSISKETFGVDENAEDSNGKMNLEGSRKLLILCLTLGIFILEK